MAYRHLASKHVVSGQLLPYSPLKVSSTRLHNLYYKELNITSDNLKVITINIRPSTHLFSSSHSMRTPFSYHDRHGQLKRSILLTVTPKNDVLFSLGRVLFLGDHENAHTARLAALLKSCFEYTLKLIETIAYQLQQFKVSPNLYYSISCFQYTLKPLEIIVYHLQQLNMSLNISSSILYILLSSQI